MQEKLTAGKAITAVLLAFFGGGVFSLIGQVLLVGTHVVLGEQSALAGPVVLVLMGIVGVVLFLAGLYQKVAKYIGFGAIMPFCGLTVACAQGYLAAKKKTGSLLKACWGAAGLLVYVVGVAAIFFIPVLLVFLFAL
ncbi:MAG: SpoVA/SpoVAEb family sporulation membrane protein [Coriobacteriales bacterium]|jgi:hypothetical protein|nr:SpoVA/SpoVAEb family sporulation membrane protein [Coriobacteriales bacterium]